MQHWLVLLLPGGFPLPRQEVQDQIPGDADHPIAPHHVVSGHYQVIAMGQVSEETKEGSAGRRTLSKEPDSGGSLQQAGAAGDHLLGADHVISVQLDKAKLIDASKNEIGFLRFHTSGFVHSSARLLQTTSQELNNQEARSGRGKDKDTIRTEQK